MKSAIAAIAASLAGLPRVKTLAVVSDANVDRLYGDGFVRELERVTSLRVERIVFPAGEGSKTLETYGELVRGFAALGLTRSDVAIALGGGVVGDLAGFAAATYMRGIDVIQVPTTLLAMVDSSIGGKTGVDIPEGKNLVGAFHLPRLTTRDSEFLKTLPKRELMNGYAEMIKTAVLFEPGIIPMISVDLPAAIERCAEWKERIVAEDFREGGRRKLLNLGHTFGHAIEKVSNFAVPHGEAVALGMRIVGREVPEIGKVLDEFGFRGFDPGEFDRSELLAAIARDKKRSGDTITLVVPAKIGECNLVEVPMERLGEWLG